MIVSFCCFCSQFIGSFYKVCDENKWTCLQGGSFALCLCQAEKGWGPQNLGEEHYSCEPGAGTWWKQTVSFSAAENNVAVGSEKDVSHSSEKCWLSWSQTMEAKTCLEKKFWFQSPFVSYKILCMCWYVLLNILVPLGSHHSYWVTIAPSAVTGGRQAPPESS